MKASAESTTTPATTAGRIWRVLGYAIGVFLILALQYRLWFSDVGYLAQREMREEIRRTEVRNARLEVRNKEMAREIEALSGDMVYIESEVREELGMVGEDETLYRLRSSRESESDSVDGN